MTRFLDWVWKHRALFGYIGIVLVAVLALEIHGEEAKQHARFRESVIADIREAERRLETLNPIQDC